MGEEDSKIEVPESATNGNCLLDKADEAVTKKEQEIDDANEMEEEKKGMTEEMDEDQHTNEGKQSNGMAEKVEEEKEEPKAESMEEDSGPKEDQDTEEKEEPKSESVELDTGPAENEDTEQKEEAKEEAEEKVDGFSEEEEEEEEEEEKVDESGAEEEKEKKVDASSAEEEEKIDASDAEQEEKTENNEEEKGTSKRGKERSGSRKKGAREKVKANRKAVKEKEEPEQRTPATDRPIRERKSVERLVASIERDAFKDFQIEKGRGTPLKDIPNVAFKLSRRKIDDTFKLLHSILFARRGKAVQIKSNISRFSGFVWHENEEKQKTRVKDKLDKCNKEKLLEFCDIMDISVAKATTKKEDIITKLMDFLVAPHATTDVLLAEKEKSSKGKKRKRVTKTSPKSGIVSSKRSAKSSRKTEDTSMPGKNSTVDTEDDSEEEVEEKDDEEHGEEENRNIVAEKLDDDMLEHSESEKRDESEDNAEEDTGKKKRSSKSPAKKKEPSGKSRTKKITDTVLNKTSTPLKRTPKISKYSKGDDDSDASPKVSSRKKIEKVVKEKSSTPRKSTSKEKTGKNARKGKEKAKVNKPPSDDQLREAICDILKEVDFNTATFTDILKQLAGQFNTDLTPRKSSIKLMIQEELTKLADEVDDEDGEDAAAAGQEKEASPAEVKVQ